MNDWLLSGLWIGMALLASLVSIRVAVSVALIEIVVGAFAGNIVGLPLAPWVNYLAGFGAILLTFLAGAEIDPVVIRKHFWSSMTIGIVGFFAPFLRSASLCSLCGQLAVGPGSNCRNRSFYDIGSSRVRRNGRNRP